MIVSLPRGQRLLVISLLALGVAGALACALDAAGALGAAGEPFRRWGFPALSLVPALLCGLRALAIPHERAIWGALAVGLVSSSAGWLSRYGQALELDAVPYPSVSDAFRLGLYAVAFPAACALLHTRVTRRRKRLWAEVTMVVFVLGAVAAALQWDALTGGLGASAEAIAASVAYPVGDILMLGVIYAAFSRAGWRPGRTWALLGAAFAALALTDAIYVHYVAAGGFAAAGTALDAAWAAAAVLIGLAAWTRSRQCDQSAPANAALALAVPTAFTLLALLVASTHLDVEPGPDLWFAAGALLAGATRLTLVFAEYKAQASRKDLLLETAAILDTAGEGIGMVGLDGRLTFVNPAAARILGHTREELLGRGIASLAPASGAVPEAIGQTLRDGVVRSAVDELRRSDGTAFPVEYTSTPIRERGDVSGATVVFHDVTQRRRAEAQARRTAAIVDASRDAIVGTSLDGVIVNWNPAAAKSYGYSREEALGRPVAMLIPPERRDERRRLLERVMRGERVEDVETVRLRKDGTDVHISLTLSAFTDDSGRVAGVASVSRDIGERLRQRGLAAAQDAVTRVLADAHSADDALPRILNELGGALGCDSVAFHPARPDAGLPPACAWRSESAAGSRGTAPVRMPLAGQGEPVGVIELRGGMPLAGDPDAAEPLASIAGQLGQYVERKRVEREADRLKDEFFALVSHELRTPITSISGYVEILLEDEGAEPLDPEQRRFLEVVQRNAGRLERLVGDLLFAAQAQGGSLALDHGVFDLTALARDCVDAARPRAADHGVHLELRAADLPLAGGDGDRIAQALDNLVSNALKFTPEGGRVEVSVAHGAAGAVIEVRDTGIGIPEADRCRLFDRFFRAAAATEHAIPGVGLGLTIAKSIVEAHGGTIAVDSAEGRGTTFRVELPLRPPAPAAPSRPAALAAAP